MQTPAEWGIGLLRYIYCSRIKTPPILDTSSYFPESATFEENWTAIRNEAAYFASKLAHVPRLHDIVARQKDLSDHDKRAWRYVSLKAFGHHHVPNQGLCPATARLIRSIPSIMNAGFSFLDPKKHVLAHRGPYGGLLRYHLGLIIPKEQNGQSQAYLRVGHLYKRVEEGRGILFDDLNEHEAWNFGDSPRAVLIIDIPRVDLPDEIKRIDRLIYKMISSSPRLQKFLAKSEIRLPINP